MLRVSVTPPASTGVGSNRRAIESHVAVSPDGRSLVFVATDELWLRPLDSTEPTRIAGTVGAVFPFWSPDNSTIGFFADGKLKSVAVTGGPVSTICDAPQGRGGSWGADGAILFAPTSRTGIFRVDVGGGDPVAVTEVIDPIHSTHRWPEFLPGGRSFLFLAASHANPRGSQSGIYLGSMTGGESRMITASDSKPVVSAGRLLFLREGDLLVQSFDMVDMKLVGEARLLAEGVRYRGGSWIGAFSASREDVLAYEIGSRSQGAQLTWMDRLGNTEGTLGGIDSVWDLRISPQGDRVAVAEGSPDPQIWIYDLDREARTRLALETTFNRAPVWSPDGERLVFAALNERGRLNMYEVSSRGAGRAELVMESDLDQVPTSWSPDGKWLAFDQGPPGATEIWVVRFDEPGGVPTPFVQTSPWAGDGQFSPDGKRLLYTSRESGVDQVYVSAFPGPAGDRWLLSAAGGGSVGRWSPDGGQVYFATAQAILMEVDLRPRKGGGLDVGMPRMLFSYRYDDSLFRGHSGFYDVTAEEERFILAQGPEREEDQGLIRLVVPWSAELEEEN